MSINISIPTILQVSLEFWGCIISLIIALLTTHRIPENDKPGKRLWLLLLTNVLTISCDSISCLYRGDESELGIWISQSANIAVYVLMLVLL